MAGLFRPKEYFRPSTVKEAVSLRAKYGVTAMPLAGGTDLIVNKDPRIEYLIDITRLPLDYIKSDKNGLKIGALTKFRELETMPLLKKGAYNALAEAAHLSGHVSQRNMATIGGNICSAVPSGDLLPSLIALAAKVKVVGTTGGRVVPLDEFFTGPKKNILKPNELLVEVQLPKPPVKAAGAFLKLSRTHVDLALVNAAVVLALDNKGTCNYARIVLGAVAPTPMRAKEAEAMLMGKKLKEISGLVEEVAKVAAEATKPISDIRASAEYRKEISQVFVKRALMSVVVKLGGN